MSLKKVVRTIKNAPDGSGSPDETLHAFFLCREATAEPYRHGAPEKLQAYRPAITDSRNGRPNKNLNTSVALPRMGIVAPPFFL